MRTYFTFMICIYAILISSAQDHFDSKGNPLLWGKVSIEDFQKEPYSEWYNESKSKTETKLTTKDAKALDDISVTIYLGTWCGDTKYLVPKFIETWERMGLSVDDLHFEALHYEGDLYKQGPNKETIDKNIHKVPTFIFERNNTEIGRIVERTVFDLDTDIRLIANGDPYEERYQAVTILDKAMAETSPDSLLNEKNIEKMTKLIRREVSTASELNAYGYVLLSQKELDKAELVFLINKKLFPYNPNFKDSYGECLKEKGNYIEALVEYYDVLELQPTNKHAIKMIAEIHGLMTSE